LSVKRVIPQPVSKVATGLKGFDALSHGGLPRNRTSLVVGGPGSGKSVFALQTLAHAARVHRERGIFVAFEENPQQIVANTAMFDWNLPALGKSKLFFLDAHLSPAVIQSGEFDLNGMLAILQAKQKEIGARWVVFDGIDVLLMLLHNPVMELREVHRVRDWLAENELTGILTAKTNGDSRKVSHYGSMQFMADCVIRLDRRLEEGMSVHAIEIRKYRGSGFAAGEFPLHFGPSGMEVAAPEPSELRHQAWTERISTGFATFDSMLGGGLFRGSSTLITGAPGTSKTTLAGKFAEAACRRHERVLFVSFDEGADPIMRNLSSVGIQLKRHVKSGLLRMHSSRTEASSADEHFVKLRSLIQDHQPHCMVIDPLSALAKAGGLRAARTVANRLVYMAKDYGVTSVLTSLVEGNDPEAESTELQISTIADTWIHLSYLVRNGERNRALSIIKSRGTWHSNQVRELKLSEAGPVLAEVYTAGGDVLMGTLRWEKEIEESAKSQRHAAELESKRRELQLVEADIHARIKALQLDLQRQRDELALYARDHAASMATSSKKKSPLHEMRSTDPAGHTVPRARRRAAASGSRTSRKKTGDGAGNAD
jgi:circadian clock protein KaiC